jgi:predicted RNase H-like nuclease
MSGPPATPLVILGIDAAWTRRNPSGVSLVKQQGGSWRCIAAAPSCDAFIAAANQEPVDWSSGGHAGDAMDTGRLLDAAQRLANAEVTLVAVDMPLATTPIRGRRAADDAISRVFGGRGCSAHSPSSNRPGPVGDRLMNELAQRQYPLATVGAEPGAARGTIEVYPHPALLELLQRDYRIPYKVGKSRRYWPTQSASERLVRLVAEFSEIEAALSREIGGIDLPLPARGEARSFASLKPREDALDALVCAWVGIRYAEGAADAYGDRTAAIWVPRSRQ